MDQPILRLQGGRPLSELVQPLLSWYSLNARVLPWRENHDPYRVWVSEIMLQQTRVEAVKPYYERFLQALPDIPALADAPEDLLFKLWEGLGYYSRVRNLQRAAQLICREYGGVFPQEPEAVRRLPGIGPYTAGAICSIAFGLPTPAVDGNVLRVVARLCGMTDNIGETRVKQLVSDSLAAVYPPTQCGDFTQALMELGALVCLPGGLPQCGGCPLASLCTAHSLGRETDYPVLPEKRPRTVQHYTVFLLRCGDRLAVRKRGENGLLSGLWELPNTEGALTADEAGEWLTAQGLAVRSLNSRPPKKHIFTHIEWRLTCFAAECAECRGNFIWATPDELKRDISLPTAFKKLL